MCIVIHAIQHINLGVGQQWVRHHVRNANWFKILLFTFEVVRG